MKHGSNSMGLVSFLFEHPVIGRLEGTGGFIYLFL